MSEPFKITSLELIGSFAYPSQFPQDGFPQFLLAGRSNVGKSSFINAMLNRKSFARVSQTPGKTRLLNFYQINQAFYFVDVPGYGYAKVSIEVKVQFQKLVETYLLTNQPLALAILLLDLRHQPTQDDRQMLAYFQSRQTPILIVCTKADKLSNNQRAKAMKEIKESLALPKDQKIVLFSSITKMGVPEVWNIVEQTIHSI